MQYRYAKTLHKGDQVICKKDQVPYIVESTEVFGQYKTVLIHCVNEQNVYASFRNEEIE
jgi:hypothetical protein